MGFWIFRGYSLGRLAIFLGLSAFAFLALPQIEQPQLLALKSASMQTQYLITSATKTSVDRSDISTEIQGPAATSPKIIRLPFFEDRQLDQGLLKIVYSIDLSNEILQQLKPRKKEGVLALDNMYGVLFTQVLNGGDFYFNGTWVAGLPAASKKERWTWHTPFLVPLPPQLIRGDGRPNSLTVIQTTHEPYISITQPYFGTTDELRRAYDTIYFFGVTLAAASNILCLVVGVFLLGVWTTSPKDSVYAVAGAASVLWAVLLTLVRWRQLDMDLYGAWQCAIYTLAHAVVYLMSMLVLSFVGQPPEKWVRNCILSIACLGPIFFAIFGRSTEPYINMLPMSVLLIFYLYAISRLTEFCVRVRNLSACVLLLQSVLCLTLAAHDYMALTRLIIFFDRQSPEFTWGKLLFDNIYLSHLGTPLHLGIMGHILLRQHKNNIAAIESRDSFLESSLLEYESNFEEIHQQMTLLARSEGAAIERERIYQDLHDGIGSQLVKAIFTLHNSDPGLSGVKQNLQACLSDLRRIINANYDSTAAVDIQAAIFAFCQAQEDHLEGSGLTISYNVGVESTVYSDPKVNLNVLRILQETLCNTIKHSDASDILVEVKTDSTHLLLTITDHGHNPSISRDRRNSLYGKSNQKGISNLASRAATIGGTYSINITRSGTQVQLSLPLPKAL